MKMKLQHQNHVALAGKHSKLKRKSTMELLTLALPGILWFVIFAYIPMGGSIIAFKNYKPKLGILKSEWVGLDNFRFMFATDDAFRVMANTLFYNLTAIILSTIVAVCIALLLDTLRKKMHIKIYQTMLFLPRFISWVVVGYMSLILFHYEYGVLNQALVNLGFDKISWYMEPKYWRVILVVAGIWKNMGYTALIYYGAVIGIDTELYEAADIDGATAWNKIAYIKLPLIRSTVIIMVLMSIGSIIRSDFGLFYYVPNNRGALFATTDVLDTYIYRALRGAGDLAGSSAGSFFQSIVGLVMIVSCNALVKKYDHESALF